MYTFKNKELTEEQIAKFAEEKGVDVATFLANNPEVKGKKQPTTQEDAEIVDVTGASLENTESPSEDGSLELEETKYITPLTREEKISLQNNQFAKQMAKENNFTKERLQELTKEKEAIISGYDTAIEREFGVNEVTDFFGDLYRAGEQGFEQAKAVDPSIDIYRAGAETSDKQIIKWIETNKSIADKNKESEEMQSFNKVYKENGGGWLGFIKGVAKNPSTLSSMLVSSIATQLGSLRSEEVLASAAAGGTAGAAGGSLFAGIGAIPGGLAGAMSGTMTAMETGLTFSELLTEEVGEDIDVDKVRKILENPEKLAELKNKALGRGVAIGAIELATMGLAKGVGGKIAKAGFKGAKPTGVAAAGAVEVVGGGTGEVAGRFVADQEMDVAEIGFEAFAGLGSAPVTMASQLKDLGRNVDVANLNKFLKEANYKEVTEAFSPEVLTSEAQVKIAQMPNAVDVIDEKLKQEVTAGTKTTEEADAVALNFRETQGAVNQIKPLRLSTKDQATAVQLMKEKKQLSNKIKQVGEPSLTIEQSNRIKEIDQDLEGIGSKAVTQEVEKVKKAAESIKDLDVQEFASTEETEAFLNEQGQDLKASGQQGFIIQDPKTGKQTIVINREIADKEIAVAAPSHEFLHALLFQTVKDSPETQLALGNSLKEYINKIDANKVKDSNFAKRLEQYKSDPEAVQAEEVLTLFSDAIRTEDIKFNETVFTKIGDVVRKALQALGVKVKFNNGKDVYNFIKDYNKSLESTGLTKAQIKAAEGITGKLVADKVETDQKIVKKSRIVSPQATALKDVLSNEELVESIKSPTTEDKFSVAQAIVEKNWPVISKQIDFTPAQQDTAKEVVEEQILGVFQGSGQGKYSARNTGLFNAFDPSVAQVNTYLGKTIGSRKPEIDLAIKERAGVTGQDLSKAEGITVAESTPAPVDAKKIKPSSLLPSDVVSKVKKEVKEKLKDVPTDKLTFKKLGNLAPEIIAEAIGIPVKKLTDATANLSKSDASAIQRFISQKPETLIKLLPEGAVLEAATQKLMGTSTGVPKSLLDAFYTKQDRTTDPSGLYPFKLNSNLNRANFLEAFGIVDGKKAKDFSPRSAEAQRLKGIASLFGRLVTNEIARTEGDLSLETSKDVAAGKSKLMFSKAELKKANESVFQGFFEITDDDFAANDRDWSKILKELGVNNLNLNDKVQREKFLESIKTSGFTAKLPKVFWRSFQGVTKKGENGNRDYDRQVFFLNVSEADAWIAQAEKEGYKFAEETQEFKDLFSKTAYTKTVNKKTVSNLNAETFNDSTFIRIQNNKIKALKKIFLTFENFIKEGKDKNNASLVAALLKSTSSWQGHFIRMSSPVKFYSLGQLFDPDTNKKLFTEEHTLPASGVAKYLFVQAASGTVNDNFNNIERNYFQGALLNADDNKLAGIGVDGKKFSYKSKTPEGWTLQDNIWARYFNPNVSGVNFGIDPNSLMTYQGKTVYDIYGVDSAGNFIDQTFNETLSKPAKVNNDKLSAAIKLSKSDLFNNNVLNVMQETDNNSQTEEIKFSKSLDLNKDFNDIIENKTGIASDKTYARVKAEVAGANKGRFNFFIPPSAEDFVGLLYSTLGKGDVGTAQMAWYKAHLLNPFARAMENLANDRVSMMQDYRGLKKALKIVPKDLRKKIKDSNFTKEQAVRVAIWDKQGMAVPGLSQKDQKQLVDFVNADMELTAFADQLIAINKGDEYASPDAGWVAGTIDTDFIKSLNTTKRSKYLEVWQQNVDQIFSEANLNKLEAAYGKAYRVAMENMLHRMKTGRNRSFGTDTITSRFTDWLTNSVGAIMFFNTRSAVLQTISAVNFINFTDNNVLKAGQAFANQPQYWSDFKKLFNSPFLLDRRSGIKLNVNEADIAEMAKGPGNSARNVVAGLLKLGFLPTQIADSFAIASGGATFYRNRIKALKKEGLTEAEAEEIAFRDFREIAEESQQSSRPDKISQQQAGPLGRIVLAFANTPAQYARLIKKAASDLKNGRGDAKTNISKIIYYGVAQNLLFSALQQALFAIGFGDEDEEEEKRNEKYFNIANGMADSILRGIGVGGAVVSVVKNTAIRLAKEADKKAPKYQDAVVKGVLQISPPVSSKVGKLQSAGRSFSWNQEEMKTMGWSIDNPAYLASAQVISAITNVPLDRAIKKITNIKDAGDENIEYYKRVALALGWSAWELGIKKDSKGKVKKVEPKTDMDKLYDLNKKQQIDSLLSLGLSKKQIKALKLEEDRVKAILDPKSVKTIKVSKRDSLFGLNKKDQVKALEKLGLTKKEIRALRLESDRVEAIINKQKQEN